MLNNLVEVNNNEAGFDIELLKPTLLQFYSWTVLNHCIKNHEAIINVYPSKGELAA